MKSPAVLRYSQQGWHPIDFSLPKACCNVCPLSGNSLLIFSGFEEHACFGVLLFVSAPGHHLYRHPAFPSHDCMKASSADTLGAGLSDFKALSQNWELNSFWWVLCHQLWPQQFALPWPVLKAVKIRDVHCIGDHLQHCLFFFFLCFLCLFWFFCWDLKVLLNPCTAGVGSCRGQGTVHFLLGQQWLKVCTETLVRELPLQSHFFRVFTPFA